MYKIIYKFIFLAIIAVFLTGIMELFSLRFQRGDVYPPYSSLRSDPLGTKVLFKSLDNLGSLSVKRNYRSFTRLEGNSDSILLYLGAGREDFQFRDKEFFQSLDQYAIQGGRLVISFLPIQLKHSSGEAKAVKKEKKLKVPDPDEDEKERNFVSLEKHWGIVLNDEGLRSKDSDPKNSVELVAKKVMQTQGRLDILQGNLPPSFAWHSTASFHCLNNSWHVLYTANEKPVMVEKALGRGSILLMTDPYFFSNESLLKDRQLLLLSAIFQSRKEVIFDEYHLGVINQHGVIDLIVGYRLHFFILSLFFIFMLLVWKNSSALSRNVLNNAPERLIESKKDYLEGLVSLLRKNIPVKDILNVCIEEWYKTRGIKTDQEIKKYIDEALSSSRKQENDPIRGYQLIYKRLTERKRYE